MLLVTLEFLKIQVCKSMQMYAYHYAVAMEDLSAFSSTKPLAADSTLTQ